MILYAPETLGGKLLENQYWQTTSKKKRPCKDAAQLDLQKMFEMNYIMLYICVEKIWHN